MVINNSLHDLLKKLVTQLELCNISTHEALAEAWMLLEKITGKTKIMLLAHKTIELTVEQNQRLTEWLDQRIRQRKPLYYVLGAMQFYDLEIFVEPPVLIPRPETEEWVVWLVGRLQPVKDQPLAILDLCTGSGCIALALARALPQAQVVGIDINPVACALANKNKAHNAVTNATFMQSDLFTECKKMTFDLIVANPPYVAKSEYETLQPEIVEWEDRLALVAPQEGMAFYERIARGAKDYLTPTSPVLKNKLPSIIVEVGQKPERVVDAFMHCGYSRAKLFNDIHGAERWAAVWV